MNDAVKKVLGFPVFHLFLALFIPLNLLAFNLSPFAPITALRAIVLFVVAAALVQWVLARLLRDADKAAIIVALILIAIWSANTESPAPIGSERGLPGENQELQLNLYITTV